jgi:hypothetical protein
MSALPALPEWLPGWAAGLIVAVVALYLLVLLAMPFSVFGLKGRLEEIEARLEEIESTLHELVRRLPIGRDIKPEDADEVVVQRPVPPSPQPPHNAAQRREPRLGPAPPQA